MLCVERCLASAFRPCLGVLDFVRRPLSRLRVPSLSWSSVRLCWSPGGWNAASRRKPAELSVFQADGAGLLLG